jgi:hypothetical protein
MEVTNHTPLTPFLFSSQDPQGRDFGVILFKGTFQIQDRGPLELIRGPAEIVYSDAYYSEPNSSSMRREGDLSPYKPRTDIHVLATATAPGDRPVASWNVELRVGTLTKTLRVTGPRHWYHRALGGWRLSAPEPCTEVPLRYEYAYGGTLRRDDSESEVLEENPVGMGFTRPSLLRIGEEISAPRIESPAEPISELGKRYKPEGMSPLAPAWLPRRAHAGTFDDRWRQGPQPQLPADFNYAFYNSAHPDLIYPRYLFGDEDISFENLHRGKPISTRLPGLEVGILVYFKEGGAGVAPIWLDTLVLDAQQQRVHLTWRACYSKRRPIASMVAHARFRVRPEGLRG